MPAGPAVTWEILVAVFGHVALFAAVTLARCNLGSDEPLFKPENTIEVALSGPPKNVTRMPQKAERAPDAPKAPAADPLAPPPNPNDMAFKTPDAPKTKGDPNAADAMQKALDDLKRRQALQDLSAPIGKEDRLASSPDGGDAGDASSSGVNDPELARWKVKARDAVAANWSPLRSICAANPNIKVSVLIDIDARGGLTEAPEVKVRSGNVSFDEAARRAVEKTGTLPAPPGKFPDGIRATLDFTGKECL